jgi:hypothetical protein
MNNCILNTDRGKVIFYIDKRQDCYWFSCCDGWFIMKAYGEDCISQIRTVAYNMKLDLGFGDVGGCKYNWVWEESPDEPVCRIEIWNIKTGVGYRFYLNCDDINKFIKTVLDEIDGL